MLAFEHVVGRMPGDPWTTNDHDMHLRRAASIGPDTGRRVFLPETVPPSTAEPQGRHPPLRASSSVPA